MQILDQAVAAIRKQAGKGRVDGAKAAAALDAIAALGEQAARIWQDYLAKPGAPGDKYTIISWIGPERAKQLFELTRQAHDLVNAACAAAGAEARFLVLDQSPIVDAYRGLKAGETGPQAAQSLLDAQLANNKHLRDLASQVRNIKPAAKSGPAKTKKPAKKAAGKAAKKSPLMKKKKPNAKKLAAAKKTTVKKKSARKKR